MAKKKIELDPVLSKQVKHDGVLYEIDSRPPQKLIALFKSLDAIKYVEATKEEGKE